MRERLTAILYLTTQKRDPITFLLTQQQRLNFEGCLTIITSTIRRRSKFIANGFTERRLLRLNFLCDNYANI